MTTILQRSCYGVATLRSRTTLAGAVLERWGRPEAVAAGRHPRALGRPRGTLINAPLVLVLVFVLVLILVLILVLALALVLVLVLILVLVLVLVLILVLVLVLVRVLTPVSIAKPYRQSRRPRRNYVVGRYTRWR